MKKEYLNAQNEEDLVEIVKAVQNGEDPGDRLKKKAKAEEAARKKAAEEEAAAREAAEKEEAKKEAAQKEEAAERKAARKQAAAERRIQRRAEEESGLNEEDEEQSEGKTQRRYGAGSVSDKAETVGNRILRSLHMEHLEEPPSEEAVEALIKDLPTDNNDESEEETGKKTKEEEIMTEIDEKTAEPKKESREEKTAEPAEETQEDEIVMDEEKAAGTAKEEKPAENKISDKEEEAVDIKEKKKAEEDTEESDEEALNEMRSGAEDEMEGKPEEESEEEPGEESEEEPKEETDEEKEEEPEEEPEEIKSVRTKKATAGGKTGELIATGVILIGIAALIVGSAVSGPGQESEVEAPQTEEAQAADLQDAEAPVLSAVNSGGMITLNASDEDSGVDTIWYAVVQGGGLSDLPQYQVYEEPIPYEDGNTYYFYAVDQAGNQSELVSIPE